ncbi:MAG TPA: hypothetical protein VGY58_18755 [Gemmataceae bacterium]|jgi:hypothetical protein|nr:hypothetical protein [Gemmataceae bacterium]
MSPIVCQGCHREIADNTEVCPHCGGAPVKVRSVLSILFWAIAGALAGAVLGPLIVAFMHRHGRVDQLMMTSAVVNGAALGAIVGVCVGAFMWAFFPYKSQPQQQAEEEPSDYRRDDNESPSD